MKTYIVTLEKPGLREGSHTYQDVRQRAANAERAEQLASNKFGGIAVNAVVAR